MESKQKIVEELVLLINKGNAHVTFEDAVKNVSVKMRTARVEALPYNIWQLVEHMRITQYDILEFCRSADYVSPVWPEGYWPDPESQPTEKEWKTALQQIKADRETFLKLLKQKDADLFSAFAHGTGQSLFREALLIADHNAYHTGQIVLLRRLLGIWD